MRGLTSRGLVLLLAAAVAAGGCAHYAKLNEGIHARATLERKHEQVSGRYTLEPPDAIEIAVRGEPILTTRSLIQPDGYATIPTGDQMYLAGLTPLEAAQKIKEELAKTMRQADVTVQVAGFNSSRVYVLGEVRSPGSYEYRGNLSVVSAVATAGGITTVSAPKRARLLRYTDTGPKIFPINLKAITRGGNDESNLLLRAGDILYVPQHRMVAAGTEIQSFMFPITGVLNAILSPLSVFGTLGP